MPLPLIQPISNLEIYVSGDVIIHESAVIGPGTILQAAPNSQIIIQEGVCLGMGTILTASQGTIVIEAGAMVGAGVLMIGYGKIGQNACIGASTTIWNASIEQTTVVPAGSLIGDTSRKITTESAYTNETIPNSPPPSSKASNNGSGDNAKKPPTISQPETPLTQKPESPSPPEEPSPVSSNPTPVEPDVVQAEPESKPATEPHSEPVKSPVVGQVYINQLLFTIFPERRSFDRS